MKLKVVTILNSSVPSSRRPVRMVDIAERAGVSRMAVSAVLMGTGNGRIGVSVKTAERIRQIADELGYRPNAAARQLAGKRSGVIAVVAHEWRDFIAQRVLAWLHECAERQGFRILTTKAPDRGRVRPSVGEVTEKAVAEALCLALPHRSGRLASLCRGRQPRVGAPCGQASTTVPAVSMDRSSTRPVRPCSRRTPCK